MGQVSCNHQVKELKKRNEIFSEEGISRYLFHIQRLTQLFILSRQVQNLPALPPKINPLLRQRLFFALSFLLKIPAESVI